MEEQKMFSAKASDDEEPVHEDWDFVSSPLTKQSHGFRARPKLVSVHAVQESMQEDSNGTNAIPSPAGGTCSLEEQSFKEGLPANKIELDNGAKTPVSTTRSSLWRLKEEHKGGLENPESLDRQKQKGKNFGLKKSEKQTSMERQHCMVGEGGKNNEDIRELVPQPAHSRVLRSSTASSLSSFNTSSADSDEVFSEGEDTATRRKTMTMCRSWRTFLTMMQWTNRSQSSWIQLAGHQGNVKLSEGGEVLKRFSEVEDICLQTLMSDVLCQFVPQYFGHISQNGERFIRLEDLLNGLKHPDIMDCKMGIRTYQEEEIIKAKTNDSLRSDMYQKMVRVDPNAPTTEEHAQRGVTKLRYLQWRDSSSSTTSLGFRIEAIVMGNGKVLRDFYKTRSGEQVTENLLSFTRSQVKILIIGSSLLFAHDRCNKANIWMIDFGKTIQIPDNVT